MALYGDFRPTGDLASVYDAANIVYQRTGVSHVVIADHEATTYWFLPIDLWVQTKGPFKAVLQVPFPLESDLT